MSMHQSDSVESLQAELLIDQYQSLLLALNEEKLKLDQQQRKEQFSEEQADSETRLKKFQEKYLISLQTLQQTLQKAISLSKSYLSRDLECKQLINALDLSRYQSGSRIQALKQQTEFLREKVKRSEEHGDQISGELFDLQERLNTVDKQYEKYQKQREFEDITQKTSLQKGEDHYLTELRESNLDLSRVLNLTKKEQSEQEESVKELMEKVAFLTHKLSNTEAKFDWQVKKKNQIEQQLIEKLQDIDHLQSEIDQLRDILRNPFERLEPDFQSVQISSEYPRKSSDQINRKPQNQQQVNFREDAHEYTNSLVNYQDITGSFIHKLSDMGVKLDSTQSANREEKEEIGLNNNRASLEKENNHGITARDIREENSQSMQSNSNSGKKVHSNKSDKKSTLSKALSIGIIGRENSQNDPEQKSIVHRIDNERCPTVLEKRNSVNAIYTKRAVELAPSQTNKSYLKSRVNNSKKAITMDPYYSHFILTSQSVKIREDYEDMLNIDVKPFYQEILDKRIPMHLWDQWIRNKLKEVMKENQVVV